MCHHAIVIGRARFEKFADTERHGIGIYMRALVCTVWIVLQSPPLVFVGNLLELITI